MKTPHLLLLSILVAVPGCARTDPYQREGIWRPGGVNDTNLRAMATMPSDLIRARPSANRTDGRLAAAAVSRLHHDRVRPLLDSGLARVTPVAGGTPPAAASPARSPE